MKHYICKGSCAFVLDEIAACETENCTSQWELMEECDCSDGKHYKEALKEQLVVKDLNANDLHDGDSVTLIKDLTLRGSSTTIKRGTKVRSIKLTDNPEEVDCKIDGMAIVLRTEFLRKI